MDPEKIKEQSQIYHLKADDKLYDYHQAINEATFTLAMENPLLLCDKTELQRQARLKLHTEGFGYKKKVSRSKEFGNSSPVPSKREYVKPDVRQKRVEQLQEDLIEVDLQLNYAAKQRERCANMSNFSKALDMSKEMEDLRRKKRKFDEEITLLKKRNLASKRVKKCTEKKKSRSTTQKGDMRQFLCRRTGDPASTQVGQSTSSDESHLTTTDQSTCSTSENTEEQVSPTSPSTFSFSEVAEGQVVLIDQPTSSFIAGEGQRTPTGQRKSSSNEDVEGQVTPTGQNTDTWLCSEDA